ncbi:MAG: tRNA uridine-5-carboxymethylaminomethyl(34) synthesis GTPase MnmE [Acidobacteriota bacterium]|nr:tRNA uridine-5-carboxymethylaminomethyl(34) synthesis GTPase MnmE [Acidobacteriota bacterium]MDW3228441.1 tRNA uridine-5-carboxymethylaminomethyl(34) synthesis GTPase MnmE [Acidobacteriota bacterium]MDY0231735.1 tRNA uridine-5-carboxymethylaminomethyl(34) synthesis GTPase MnmE [Candidatus Saccharicenans sp.]
MIQTLEDTIIAVSTPPGPGGIGIVRLSGSEALSIAQKIFAIKGLAPEKRPGTLCFGYLLDFERQETLDAGYFCYFPALKSYTREEVVEINLHGSPVLLAEAVRLGIKAGARLARPGEFTLRAYLNGRLDIIQVEAINDLIRASTLDQAKVSFNQLQGSLSRKIFSTRDKLVELLSLLETSLEFPDEDHGLQPETIKGLLNDLLKCLEKLIKSYEQGRVMMEGLTVALLGKTNVGKSTLFNALLEEERSIVTPHPGTTRDYIRENIQVDGVLMRLVDMAGFGLTEHPVEEEGIKRSQKVAEEADGLLLILDVSRKEDLQDLNLLERFKNKKKVLVFNKCDLKPEIDWNRMIEFCPDTPVVKISALRGTNLDELKRQMLTTFSPDQAKQEEIILHEHQKILLEKMKEPLAKALGMVESGYGGEIVVEEIRGALTPLGQLTGEIKSQEVLEGIFKRFCVGK